MALFKILRGNANDLPTNFHDGWAYFTTDTHEFFIDYTDNEGQLQRASITAPKLIPRLSDNGVYHLETLTSTPSTISYLSCGSSSPFEADIIYNAGDSSTSEYSIILQCV